MGPKQLTYLVSETGALHVARGRVCLLVVRGHAVEAHAA